MKPLSTSDVLMVLCKATAKWGLYIKYNGPEYDFNAMLGAASFLDVDRDYQVLAEGRAIVLFNTERAMRIAYKKVVGDDGPTKLNAYTGPGNWYALTCSNTGKLLTENT